MISDFYCCFSSNGTALKEPKKGSQDKMKYTGPELAKWIRGTGRGEQEEDDDKAFGIKVWAAANFIRCVVPDKLFTINRAKKVPILEWVTRSDLAFVFMVIDMYYGEAMKELEAARNPKERRGVGDERSPDRKERSFKNSTLLRTGYLNYVEAWQHWSDRWDTDHENMQDWKGKFNAAFEDELNSQADTTMEGNATSKKNTVETEEMRKVRRLDNAVSFSDLW